MLKHVLAIQIPSVCLSDAGIVSKRLNVIFAEFSTNTRHWYITISQKWFQIDGYNKRGTLQALDSLSNCVKFTAIVPGASPGEAKMC